jgi:hypothetical protein
MPVGRLGTQAFAAGESRGTAGSVVRPAADPSEPVGHGTIRLLGREDMPAVLAAEPTPPEPVGHGSVRLYTPPLPGVHTDPVTTAAVADILAAVAAS